ncbi:flagellar filament capping protein FliD [Clostridium tagluense]|uniref:flagellar filament capping protein FliD n=1 Tax=Clostridium tagluense TaxID=360422 RepID=UPI001C0AEE4F|nr:flagellar filament capping protein FliD [Clostridium tagluense]MBU3126678.1 flagellar filament capping protein FliD [Clostridium tagluense]
MRITGMASGLDTDTLIKQMMKPYNMRVDKMKQDRQVVAWKQELYRDILSDTTNITDTYFNNLKSDTNMLSKNTYSGFDVTAASSDPTKSAGASATASVGAVAGNYSVEVMNLAETAKIDGAAINESSDPFDFAKWQGKIITFKVGGAEESITIDNIPPVTDRESLVANINDKLAKQPALAGKINVSEGTKGGIKFNALTNDSVKVVSTTVADEMSNLIGKVINPNKYTTKLSDLGIVDGGKLTFDYKDANGVTKKSEITVSKDATISQLIDEVNTGTSGAVKLNFSELTNQFNIETLQTGSSASLKVTEDGPGGVLTNLKLNSTKGADGVVIPYVNGSLIAGKDATVKITPPGIGAVATTVTKPGNNFFIDGVNYTITKEGITNITVAGNSQKPYDKIKGFIDKYNELVDKVSQKTGEKKQYKYLPLTDEQRTAMKEDEIKQWETKAKVGLLKGDSNLDNMLTSMRRAFYEGVEDAGISLSEIGLSTSKDISQRGKIIIDEKKLKSAIETKGEQVANLFTKKSTTYPLYNTDATSTEKSTRNKEQGIFQKINDIIQDYTRTSRNNNGKKGILLEKAGIKGDPTEFKSLLSEDIIKKDAKITEMIKNLAARENSFYLKFSKLEVAMNKLNSQSSWLTQQLGGGQ